MSFLQPWMLAAIPLVAIPIVIHLVNQRRFQTVPWAAMRFLLEANKMSSGTTRLRQWLILAMRTLALAALIFFTARPLTSGILAALSGDSQGVAIVILDRSPSMGDTGGGNGSSRLELGVEQLADTFQTLGIQRIVQIGGGPGGTPEEFGSLAEWVRSAPRTAWSATSDIPALLEQAMVYVKNNPSGNAVVWLCSDLRESDWRSRDGRWAAIRDGFLAMPQRVRFSLLDLSQGEAENRSIRVTEARCVETDRGSELSLSFRIDRSGTELASRPGTSGNESNAGSGQVPVEISVGTSRFVLNVDLTSATAQVNDYRLPLDKDLESESVLRRGWGWVRLPSDSNPLDDISYFVFEQPPPRRTVIVSESPELIAAIELSASIAPQQSIRCEAERVSVSQLDAIAWESLGLIVWHEPLPTGRSLELLENFLDSGGELLLVPPETPDDTTAFGIRWVGWESVPATSGAIDPADTTSGTVSLARIAQWQNDSQLLANTLSGAALPLGQLGVRRLCGFEGTAVPLASLPDGRPILARVESWRPDGARDGSPTDGASRSDGMTGKALSGITLCTTTPSDRDSTLAGDGVVLYVAIQRLLAAGSQRVATVRGGTAGIDRPWSDANVELAAGDEVAPSSEYAWRAGVYAHDGMLYAFERGLREDDAVRVDENVLGQMFGELSWVKAGVADASRRLVQEIWRWFVVVMLIALLVEAALSLPRVRRASVRV